MESIKLPSEDGTEIELYILEQTTVGGIDYYLVTESEEEDGDAMILKDVSESGDEEALLEFVEDDTELKAIGEIFAKLLENTDLTGVTE